MVFCYIINSLQNTENKNKNYSMTKFQTKGSNAQRESQIEDIKREEIEICQQFLIVSPVDHNSWNSIKKQLEGMVNEKYSTDTLLNFIQTRFQSEGYPNVRLLRKVKTEYFWNAVTNFMLNSIIQDSHLISGCIHIMEKQKECVLNFTKYQIFLIMTHMLFGTFPRQLYNDDISFGRFMTVYNDEDQVSTKQILQFRQNKLKAIIRYFCVFMKRNEDNNKFKDENIVFHRTNFKDKSIDILSDNVKLCKVNSKVGQFYKDQLNKISINNMKRYVNLSEKQVKKAKKSSPILGSYIYDNYSLDLEQRIIFSHVQLLILPLFIWQGLQTYESLVVHGVEKFAELDALSKHTVYNFKAKNADFSDINKLGGFKNTSFIFVQRSPHNKRQKFNIIEDIKRLYAGIKACSLNRSTKDVLISGKYITENNIFVGFLPPDLKQDKTYSLHPVPPTKLKSLSKLEQPWEIKFITQWLAASLSQWHQFDFYVQHEIQQVDIRIMTKQMKEYTIKDFLNILDQYWEFRTNQKGRVTLIQFIKQFVL